MLKMRLVITGGIPVTLDALRLGSSRRCWHPDADNRNDELLQRWTAVMVAEVSACLEDRCPWREDQIKVGAVPQRGG